MLNMFSHQYCFNFKNNLSCYQALKRFLTFILYTGQILVLIFGILLSQNLKVQITFFFNLKRYNVQ